MGFSKKLHARDEVSGLHQHVDIQDGTHGAEDLAKRNQARQDDLNSRIKGDWPQDMTATLPESHPTLGNALTRTPKPTDVGGSDSHYGVREADEARPGFTARKSSPSGNYPKGGDTGNGPKAVGRG